MSRRRGEGEGSPGGSPGGEGGATVGKCSSKGRKWKGELYVPSNVCPTLLGDLD